MEPLLVTFVGGVAARWQLVEELSADNDGASVTIALGPKPAMSTRVNGNS